MDSQASRAIVELCIREDRYDDAATQLLKDAANSSIIKIENVFHVNGDNDRVNIGLHAREVALHMRHGDTRYVLVYSWNAKRGRLEIYTGDVVKRVNANVPWESFPVWRTINMLL